MRSRRTQRSPRSPSDQAGHATAWPAYRPVHEGCSPLWPMKRPIPRRRRRSISSSSRWRRRNASCRACDRQRALMFLASWLRRLPVRLPLHHPRLAILGLLEARLIKSRSRDHGRPHRGKLAGAARSRPVDQPADARDAGPDASPNAASASPPMILRRPSARRKLVLTWSKRVKDQPAVAFALDLAAQDDPRSERCALRCGRAMARLGRDASMRPEAIAGSRCRGPSRRLRPGRAAFRSPRSRS